MKENFYSWLRHEKYTIILTIVCAFIPFLGNLDIWWESDLVSFFGKHSYKIANLLFILATLVMLTSTGFLINKDEKKSRNLYNYARRTFGVNCELYRYGEHPLFRKMDVGVKQFYYSWICVWCIWLVLYLNDFIYGIYSAQDTIFNVNMFRLNCFVGNLLNLLNSIVLFFIYMVITISTVNNKNPSDNHRSMHIGVICLICVAALVLFTDLFSFTVNSPITYHKIQFYLRLFIGVVASISLIAVVGRLNSSYLNVPQWLMIGLYLYAAIQMLYPIAYDGIAVIDSEKVVCCSKSKNTIRLGYAIMQDNFMKNMIYSISFLGKVCLFLMIRWVATQKRFLFFLVHKSNSLSESTIMLRDFYKIYEGYSDAEK